MIQLQLMFCCVIYFLPQPAVAQWHKHLDHLPGHQILPVPACKDDGAAHVPTPTAANHEAVHAQPFSHSKYTVRIV
jgi:hypothetical protein